MKTAHNAGDRKYISTDEAIAGPVVSVEFQDGTMRTARLVDGNVYTHMLSATYCLAELIMGGIRSVTHDGGAAYRESVA